MAEQTITIGGKEFRVAYQPGEESFLHSAAQMLDTEAQTILSQGGRMPEVRMLLMAGLLLADRTASLEDQLRSAEEALAASRAEVEALRARPAPAPERVEVPVIPAEVTDSLAELAARAEALAQQVEDRAAPG